MGVWLEYTHKPKPKSEKEQSLEDRFNRLGGIQSMDSGTIDGGTTDPFSGGLQGRRGGFGGGLGRSSFGAASEAAV